MGVSPKSSCTFFAKLSSKTSTTEKVALSSLASVSTSAWFLATR